MKGIYHVACYARFHHNIRLCQTLNYSTWGSKKQHRKVKVNINWNDMADTQMEKILSPLRDRVKEQVSCSKN